MRKIIAVCLFAIAGTSLALAAGDWRDAQDKVRAFETKYTDLRRMTPRETRRIVDAICHADDGKRKEEAKAAGLRARKKVTTEYTNLKNLKDDATTALDAVLADTSLSSHHSDARGTRSKISRHWTSIGKMTRSVRGANHPVIAYTLEQGNKAHRDYQKAAGNCDATEFSVTAGRLDCIKMDKTTCTVIELKPDNRKAIDRGKRQALTYARDLRAKGSNDFKKLVLKDSKFSSCTKFTARVDCYTLCPTIDENGDFEKATPSWRTGC